MGYRIGQFTQPKCYSSDDGKHHVTWDYTHPNFESDLVHIDGDCNRCGLEFQKTFQQTEGLTVIAKASRNVFDFNQEVVEEN